MRTCLSNLISKGDWNGVHQRLQTVPEEASIPIPTGIDGKVYALHQAVCKKASVVPQEVLLLLIKVFPNAVDSNAFVGACENPRFSRDLMEVLLDGSRTEIYQNVAHNAKRYISIAVKKKSTCIVDLFMERFPDVLRSNILSYACIHGTAEIVEKIIVAGLHQNIGKAGGLFLKKENKEDALEAAIRLYDEEDDERHRILVTCIQHANAIKMSMEAVDPRYSVILAAIGLVPPRILKIFLRLYTHEITNLNTSGKHAMLKAIRISMKEDKDDYDLPPIFRSPILRKACTNGQLEIVQQLLEESTRKPSEHIASEQSEKGLWDGNEENALEIAIDLLDENDNIRCRILRICILHANAVKLGKKNLPPKYPTILAAIGIVPVQALLRIGKIFKHEISMLDRTGKLVLKKVLKMVEEETQYALYLDKRRQYPLSFPTTQIKFDTKLETIVSERAVEGLLLKTVVKPVHNEV